MESPSPLDLSELALSHHSDSGQWCSNEESKVVLEGFSEDLTRFIKPWQVSKLKRGCAFLYQVARVPLEAKRSADAKAKTIQQEKQQMELALKELLEREAGGTSQETKEEPMKNFAQLGGEPKAQMTSEQRILEETQRFMKSR